MVGQNIFNEFRRNVDCKILYKKYKLTEEDLIIILQRNIKGSYDYKRILRGGIKAQRQLNKHLSNRWNPLDPEAPWESVSPYLPNEPIKKRDEE